MAHGLYERLPARSISAKLALVFGLFLAPLGFLVVKWADVQQNRIELLKRERVGLGYLAAIRFVRATVDDQIRAEERGGFDGAEVRRAASALRQAQSKFGDGLGVEDSAERAHTALGELPAAISEHRTAGASARRCVDFQASETIACIA
jgi:hypothetical protein